MPKFYQTPKGTISTSEKRWKDDMKAEGLNPKDYDGLNTFEVPIKAAELAEFLTFHNVNVVNPQAPVLAAPAAGSAAPIPPALPAAPTTVSDIDEVFEALPLAQQLHLAGLAVENARAKVR